MGDVEKEAGPGCLAIMVGLFLVVFFLPFVFLYCVATSSLPRCRYCNYRNCGCEKKRKHKDRVAQNRPK